MGGGGFIQQMVNVMRDNHASLTSKTKRSNAKTDLSKASITPLRFPSGTPERIANIRKRAERKSTHQWIIIYILSAFFIMAIILGTLLL